MLLMSILLTCTREISKCCLGPALIRMVMLLVLATIYQVIHTLQQKQLDWVPILLQKFQLPLLAVILLYSPVGLTPLKISIRFEFLLGNSNLIPVLR